MNKQAIVAVFIFLGAILIAGGIVSAASEEDIVYPVKELGNCQNETECRSYCEKPANMESCVNFAEKHNLMSRDEVEKAKKFISAGSKGPGGCDSQSSCESYCNDVKNINECLTFAERHGLMPPEELAEAKKVQSALAKGASMPGGCRNKTECEVYCENAEHMEECIAFAESAGFIPPDELEEARMALSAIKKGIKPPPCRGKKECDTYCSEPQNFDSCLVFAEAAGFISPEEALMARKTGGKGPGDCRGREECERFCEDENNISICIDFAAEHGLMSKDEVEMAKKTGGKGPGGCKGKEECESFCENPANQEACFNFAKEHGLIPEEDLRNIEEGRGRMQEAFTNAPPEALKCLEEAMGSENFEKLKTGTMMPSEEIGDIMRGCFEKAIGEMMRPEGGEFPGMMPPPGEGLPRIPEGMEPQIQQKIEHEIETKIRQYDQPPSPEIFQQIQGQIREDIEHQIEEQIRQEMERQLVPPPPPPPEGYQLPKLIKYIQANVINLVPPAKK